MPPGCESSPMPAPAADTQTRTSPGAVRRCSPTLHASTTLATHTLLHQVRTPRSQAGNQGVGVKRLHFKGGLVLGCHPHPLPQEGLCTGDS